jgi:mono/diheme cytochrome c family protein
MIVRIVGSLVAVLALTLTAAPGQAADVAKGRKLYVQNCEKCHGKAGKGDGSLLKRMKADVKPVDYTDKAAMAKWSDADMTKIIKEGGHAAGRSKVMPSYSEKLSDADVADLIAYIRSLAK